MATEGKQRSYPERSNLRSLIWGTPKHRPAKFLVELQVLCGGYGTMFFGSASVRMLSLLM